MPTARKTLSTAGERSVALRYQQVYDLVLNLIEAQGLTEGDRLPSTTELAELAGVSSISVRRALDELTKAGRIARHQGVGTFVASQRIVAEPSRPGALLETLRGGDADAVLTTELLSIVVGTPSLNHVEALGIGPGQPVWEISRLRSLGGVPKVLETAVLPLSRVPALDETYLAEGGSLYATLCDRYGLTDDLVEQALEVDYASSRERERLHLNSTDRVMKIRGVSFTADSVAFDCYQQVYPAHEFIFYTSGTGSPKLLQTEAGEDWAVTPLGLNSPRT